MFRSPLLSSNIDGVWKAYDTYSRRSLFTHAYVSSLLLSACTEGGGRETGPRIFRNILLAHRDIRVETFGWNPRHLKDFNSSLAERTIVGVIRRLFDIRARKGMGTVATSEPTPRHTNFNSIKRRVSITIDQYLPRDSSRL